MRNTLSAAIVAGAFVFSGGTALAADLLYVPEPIAQVSPTWADGFYIGLHAGYGFGNADHIPATPIGPGGNVLTPHSVVVFSGSSRRLVAHFRRPDGRSPARRELG